MYDIIFVLLLPFTFGADLFTEHLKRHVNQDYPPCLDFYRHVCPTNLTKDDLYRSKIQNATEKFIAPYRIEPDPLYEEILGDVESHAHSLFELLDQGNLTAEVYDRIEKEIKHTRVVVQTFVAATALPTYIKFFKSEFGSSLIAKMKKYESMTKDVLEKHFKETPWIVKNDNDKDVLVGRLRLIEMYHNLDEMEKFLADVRPFASNYEECKAKLLLAGENPITFCFREGEPKGTPEEATTTAIFMYERKGFNFQGVRSIIITLATMLSAMAEDPVLSADAIFVLGHEIGHEFFKSPRETYFSNISVTNETACILKTKQRVCDIFHNEHACSSGAHSFNEDVADFFAIDAAYEVMRDLMGEQFTNANSEIPEITNEQRLFYNIAVPWCMSREDLNPKKIGSDPHSSGLDRMYMLMWHSSYFKNAFNCPNDSPMILEEEQKCHLFDKHAKPYKH